MEIKIHKIVKNPHFLMKKQNCKKRCYPWTSRKIFQICKSLHCPPSLTVPSLHFPPFLQTCLANKQCTYPKYLYPQNAIKSRVLTSACTLQTYMENRIAMISTTNQIRAELAVIPSCSGVNLNTQNIWEMIAFRMKKGKGRSGEWLSG